MREPVDCDIRVLLVADDPGDAESIRRHLETSESPLLPGDVSVRRVAGVEGAADVAADERVDLLMLTLELAGSTGRETYERARDALPDLPVVVLTDDEHLAAELLEAGADDYVDAGSIDEETLVRVVRHAIERRDLRGELDRKTRAIEAAPVGITISDPSQEDNPLIYVNRHYEAIAGYDRSEAVGRNCRFLQGEATDDEPVAAMRAAIDAADPVTVELRNYRKDGQQFWNRVSIAPVENDRGEVANFVGFQQDVTDRVERERRLQTTRDQLEVLNRVLRHDIRNDVDRILGYGELLDGSITDDQQRALEEILAAADHIHNLTENSRALMELVTGDPDLDTDPTRVDEVLVGEVRKVQSAYEEASVELVDPLPTTPVAANDLLGSVFRNLLHNAVQHGGEAPEVRVRLERGDDAVRVTVDDDGPGVPDDRKESIFGKGQRGLDSEGTGIGLFLVDTLVGSYGGDVWVEDGDLGGARFVVELPLLDGVDPTASTDPSAGRDPDHHAD